MIRLRRRLGPWLEVLRLRSPAVATAIEQARIAARGRGRLVAETALLRRRLGDLERDHLLLAAHVAVLTERLGGDDEHRADDDAARQRARLAAIAFYEERIGALEAHARRPLRRRRTASRPVDAGRTVGGDR